MRLFVVLSCLCLSISSYGQRPPIPNLPAISLADVGFNMDSINALIPILDNFKQLDFRGLVVIKNNKAVMEWCYNNTDSYGMLWYKTQETFSGKKIDYLWASGNGGNHLVVVPEENMVIALTATAYGYWYGQLRARRIMTKLLNALE